MPNRMQKAKEAMGYQKKVGHETQEPAGVMENRLAHGGQPPTAITPPVQWLCAHP